MVAMKAPAEVVIKAESQEPALPENVPIPQDTPAAPPSQESQGSEERQEANPFQALLDERLATNEELKSISEELEEYGKDRLKVRFRVIKIEEQLKDGSVAKECNEFFDAMLASVQEEPETRDSLEARLTLLQSSTFKTRLIRLLIYESAVDYINGTNTYFSELKEQMANGESMKEIKTLNDKIEEIDRLVDIKEKQRTDLMESIYTQVKAEEQAHAADLERLRVVAEEEAREAQAMKELERMRLEQDALTNIEEEKQRALQEERDRLNNTGYAASEPYIVGEGPVDGVEETYEIKSEKVDHIADLLREFKKNDRAGRRAIRALRAAQRAETTARRARGEKVREEEWIEELDGKFDDDSDEDTTSTIYTSANTSAEKSTVPTAPNSNAKIFSWDPPSTQKSQTFTSTTIPSKRTATFQEHTGAHGSRTRKVWSFPQYRGQRPAQSSSSYIPNNGSSTSRSQGPSIPMNNGDPRRSTYIPSANSNGDPRRAPKDPRFSKATDPRRGS